MYQKILIAYDGSSFSDVALRQGVGLASLCKAEVHLVGIVATSTHLMPGAGFGTVDIWGMERDLIVAALEEAEQSLSSQGLQATSSIRNGNPAAEIAACASEQGADLVVIGHSDKSVLAKWFEGSVGSGLLGNLSCNMLIATS